MTLYEVLKENSMRYGECTAYSYFKEKCTFSELIKAVEALGARLFEDGIRKGDSVAVCLPNCPHLMASIYGINMIGARVVLLNPKSPADELKRQLVMTDAKALIFSTFAKKNVRGAVSECDELKKLKFYYSSILEGLPMFFKMVCQKKLYPFGDISAIKDMVGKENCVPLKSVSDAINTKVPVNTDDKDDAIVIFSGGTSGEIKAIVHSSVSINNSARSCAIIAKDYPPHLRILAILPAFHIFGLTVAIHFPMYSAGECVLVPFFHMGTIAKIIANDCPHVLPGVPTIFNRISHSSAMKRYEKHGKVNISNFIWGICGGDYLTDDIRRDFTDFIKRNGGSGYISMGYGMSECCPIAVSGRNDKGEGCVGEVFFGCRVTIDSQKESDSGELCLKSDFLMTKYFYEDKKEIYPLKDENGESYIKTGDIGHMSGNILFYEYRMRRIIKVSGNTIFAGTVENVILKHSQVSEVHVVSVPHPTRGNSAFAFVVLKDSSDSENVSREIYELCRTSLLPYAIPAKLHICSVEDIDRTPLGKIAYGVLEKKAKSLMNS